MNCNLLEDVYRRSIQPQQVIAVYYDSSWSHLCRRPTALNVVVVVHGLLGEVSSNWQVLERLAPLVAVRDDLLHV